MSKVGVRATLRLQNLDMVQAEKRLAGPIYKLCKEAGVDISTYYEFKRFDTRGWHRKTVQAAALRISVMLELDVDKILIPELLAAKINSRVVVDREVDIQALLDFSERARRVVCSPDLLLDEKETAARITEALDGLPPKWRKVLRRRLDGAPLSEIAAEMHLSDERVRQIEARATRALREKFDPSAEPVDDPRPS